MSERLHITSAHDMSADDRFPRHVTSPPLNSLSFFLCVCVLGFFVLLGSDGGFNQESRQFINPKEGACTALTERTWF